MRKTLLVIGIVLVLFALGIWLFLSNVDSVAKSAIEKYGKEVTQVAVSLGEIHLSPNTGEGRLRDLMIANPSGFHTPYAFSFADTLIKLDVQSLKTHLFLISELNMIAPDINIEQNASDNNIHMIQENIKAFISHQANANAQYNRFIIESLTIQNAKLHVSAPQLQADLITIPLADIHLNNVGSESGGVSAAEVMDIVMQQINIEIAQAIRSRGLEKTVDVNLLVPEAEQSLTDRIRNFFTR